LFRFRDEGKIDSFYPNIQKNKKIIMKENLEIKEKKKKRNEQNLLKTVKMIRY